MLPLFLYGTLQQGMDPMAERLHRVLRHGQPATVRGWLYALPDPAGWYPALVPDDAGGPVCGTLHAPAAGFTPADLAALDAYEGYRPEDPAGSDYGRRPMVVAGAGGTPCPAQAWCRQAPLPAATVPIAEGRFAAWLARTCGRAFGAQGLLQPEAGKSGPDRESLAFAAKPA